jgi:hypothetical protein
MKSIILNIEEDVFKELTTAIGVKKLCDAFYSVSDQALAKILDAISKGDTEFTLKFKEK